MSAAEHNPIGWLRSLVVLWLITGKQARQVAALPLASTSCNGPPDCIRGQWLSGAGQALASLFRLLDELTQVVTLPGAIGV